MSALDGRSRRPISGTVGRGRSRSAHCQVGHRHRSVLVRSIGRREPAGAWRGRDPRPRPGSGTGREARPLERAAPRSPRRSHPAPTGRSRSRHPSDDPARSPRVRRAGRRGRGPCRSRPPGGEPVTRTARWPVLPRGMSAGTSTRTSSRSWPKRTWNAGAARRSASARNASASAARPSPVSASTSAIARPERHNAGLRSPASSAQRSVSSQAWSARAPSTSSSQSFDQLASSSARP